MQDTTDVVNEVASEGTDTVQSSVTYTLGANVENLTLTGTAAINGTGNALNNVILANAGNNVLTGSTGTDTVSYANAASGVTVSLALTTAQATGGSGSDTLSGFENIIGSASNDSLTGSASIANTLTGGAGNDTYVVQDGSDNVVEQDNEGTDTVQSSVTYFLTAYVENLTLTGASAISGTGNSLNNTITGNSAANTRSTAPSATTPSSAEPATYIVNCTFDVVTELAGGGIDTVKSSASYTLSAEVENLTLTGTGNINATGNALANILTGNSGNNALDGGAGADTLVGGKGDDMYTITSGDTVTAAAGEGTDTIRSDITVAALGTNVENLTLTGTAAFNGTGNALGNTLTGNSANNSLTGGSGADQFIFNTGLNAATNVDTITDFAVVDDTIVLENAIFTALTATGMLGTGNLVIGTSAVDADEYIIYDAATGSLSYDGDGSGLGAATKFAAVSASLALTNADFLVI